MRLLFALARAARTLPLLRFPSAARKLPLLRFPSAARKLPLLRVIRPGRTLLGTFDNLEAFIVHHFSKRTVLKFHNRARSRFFVSGIVR